MPLAAGFFMFAITGHHHRSLLFAITGWRLCRQNRDCRPSAALSAPRERANTEGRTGSLCRPVECRARSVDRACGFFLKPAQRGIDNSEILLEHGSQAFHTDPTPGMHPAFMQETLAMFAHLPQRLAVFKSNVAGNDVFNGLGHN